MKKQGLQQGKTRWTHYQTGYHFVWIPKYRKKSLSGKFRKNLSDWFMNVPRRMDCLLLQLKQILTMFTFLCLHLPGILQLLLPTCWKVIPQECYASNFLFSKENAEKISFGLLHTMSGQLVQYPRKRLFDISQNAGVNSTLSSQSPKRDEDSRVLSKTKKHR